MRKWRLFFITLISFIAILGENWVKKIIPISLCILLNSNSVACYINFNDGRVEAAISNINVTDNSSNKILTINQDLSTKQEDNFQHKLPSQIAIPPIIRPAETNLYLQNALPQDFRISNQIPYGSGKQEILLVSPSTGAEQLYTFNVPGSPSFQLFEVEYKKVSDIDFSSLTNTDSLIVNPEQIKSVLNRFRITFANNSLSKITLSDGTTANFFAGQAVIKSPQSQTVETVQISQNEFIDKNIFISQARSKINKNIENNTTNKDANLLAKNSESACQAAVSSSLNGISDNLGQWGNKLTTSNSLITKSVGWAISFSSGAIKSNISTKNPMLQEVNCRPPVQCEEQRVSGGSEIRTDLFQVAKDGNAKVNLQFEFYQIPDRIELYFDGKQIFGVGPQSGQGNQTFDLPTNAEYVGVKLIGNDDVNTRWWYVISCSGSVIAEAPKCENVVNQNYISNSLGDLLQVPYINSSISFLTHKQQSKKIKIPSFYVMEKSYPYGSTDQVKSEIGGKVNAGWINNTCAIRMSRVLNYSAPELQISKQGNLTISGNDKKWYFYRVSDLIKYLTNNLGKADIYLTRTNTGEIDISKLKDKKGIIIFKVPFADATGHATLWNGRNCVDEQCYFDRATEIYLWISE